MALLSRTAAGRGRAPVSSLRVALAIGGLLALVAVVAAGHRTGSGRGSRPSRAFFDYLLSGFLVFMTVGAVAFVYLLVRERDQALDAVDPVTRRRRTIATIALVLALAAAFVIGRERGFPSRTVFHRANVPHAVAKPHPNGGKPLPSVERRFRWLPAIL